MLTCRSSSRGGNNGGGGGGRDAGGVGLASFKRLVRVSAADVAKSGPVCAAAGDMRPK